MSEDEKITFEQAGKQSQPSLVREIVQMLKHNRKYWLIPLIVILLFFGVLIILGGTAVAPFIYTLF